jgi:predicted metal-dependent hydrolase
MARLPGPPKSSDVRQPALIAGARIVRSREADRGRASLAAREKAALWARLEADAKRVADHFGLEYRTIEPEREGVRRHYGICYSDGTIRIRLRHSKTGRALKYSSLVNTVCHELAHLKHFNHGERFKKYYFRLLSWARQEGIYRPAGSEPPPPRQLGLFSPLELAVPARRLD